MTPFGAGVAAYPAVPARVVDLAPDFGIYVHIPFCSARCPYCDFNTYVGMDDQAPAYLDALVAEAGVWADAHRFRRAGSLFVGGGTPTLGDPHVLARALRRITEILPLEPGAEITVEANPETVAVDRLGVLRAAGVNRVSIGAQSFVPRVLTALGRWHTVERTREAFAAARAAGFENVNLDLIFGAPGETLAEWRASLGEAVALEPEHVSCYSLTIEPGTAFGADVAAGRMRAPDDDAQAERYEAALDVLASSGYEHYEISNWARPGRTCRHNLVYWTQGDYVGLGAGAHSHVEGVRSWNRKLPAAYAADPTRARADEERLDLSARAEEWLQIRLRLVEGIDLAEASARLGRDLSAAARRLAEDGLVAETNGALVLTRRGLLLESEVALRLGS